MKPLASLKILDLTDGNPYPGSLFADYGAEVLKIEPPGGAIPSAAGAQRRTGRRDRMPLITTVARKV